MKPQRSFPLAISILILVSLACSVTGQGPAAVPSPEAAPGATSSPTDIPAITPSAEPSAAIVTGIAAGALHMCQISNTGQAACWGSNDSNQLGDGTMIDRPSPTLISGLSNDIAAITAGSAHTCALTTAGAVKCWGQNITGQIGDGTNQSRLNVVNVVGLESGITAISAGYDHTCALTEAGGVKCWGKGLYGRLGDGKGSRWSGVPVDVSDLQEGVAAVAAGDEHTCALMKDGGVKCWGYNDMAELGTGTEITMSKVPADVYGLNNAVALDAGFGQSCAVTDRGEVLCWGWDGMEQVHAMPNPVAGVQDAVSVTLGIDHACALTRQGEVVCWGVNDAGQLGDGSTRNSTSGVVVKGLKGGATAISAGFRYTCALMEDGQVQCWGGNVPGQIANGSTTWNLERSLLPSSD